MTHTFLIEIGTEELPPTSLKALSDAFSDFILAELQNRKIAFEHSRRFATPRRLALLIEGLATSTPESEEKVWGPPTNIAFDGNGKPTKAAEAFAQKNNLTVNELVIESDGKQEKLVCLLKTGGEPSKNLLGGIIGESLKNLPIKKRMRWGASRIEFVRPVQWVLALLDGSVLPETILGCAAGNLTRGHRFQANTSITISNANQYESLLETEGKVIADFAKRRALIKKQVEAQAARLNGSAIIDEDLLDEVTALVEWPVALAGKFDESFLRVPPEALISSMKEHQKYFHVVDANKQLLPCFITISNLESRDAKQVIAGNERVIRPRLSDAAFFFETDKKHSLESRREKLKTVLFQEKLGSLFDKTERIRRLAKYISKLLDLNSGDIDRAAQLCKSDLVSSMVYEFPDMQGIAGYHYALNDGESADVAKAMLEQYLPKFSGDAVPTTDVGAIIALADRIDTVTGIFGIGLKPSGSKDPFALRRASLGILRIIVEKNYNLDLRDLVSFAVGGFYDLPAAETVLDEVISYCIERFKAWYQEEGLPNEIFQAVHAKNLSNPLDINLRVKAVAAFLLLPEALPLAEANKRVSNILSKNNITETQEVVRNLLVEGSEIRLFKHLEEASMKFRPLFQQRNYTEALQSLAYLKDAVDLFFDNVMVMVDDAETRRNRLALLQKLRAIFFEIADISVLAVKG